MAAHLVEAGHVSATTPVLDVGCGTGYVAITAARRGAAVTGLDITPAMLTEARKNADVAGVENVRRREGTATDLPFEDEAFDVTLSSVGHVYADHPDAAARELLRVTRPGGRIAFTSWTPESVVPATGRVLTDYLPSTPPPPRTGTAVPVGRPDVVRERLGDSVGDLEFETGTVLTPVLSPQHYLEAAITQSGLFIVALETVAADERPALRTEMIETIEQYFEDRQNAVPMDYRLTTAVVERAR